MVHLTVCFYHVTYAFQSESTLCSCLNVKEILALNRDNIWSLSDCNRIWTHNNLVCKWTLNHLSKLDKWLSCVVSTYHLASFVFELSSCGFESHCRLKLQILRLFWARSSLTFSNYRIRIHFEMHRWHNKNIESNATYRSILKTQLNHL